MNKPCLSINDIIDELDTTGYSNKSGLVINVIHELKKLINGRSI